MGSLKLVPEDKKYSKSQSSGSGSSSASGASSSSSHESSSIWEDSPYNKYANRNQKKFTSGTDAAAYLQQHSSLFNRSVVDGAYAVNELLTNTAWGVDMDVDGDGVIEDGVAIADAIAASFDSELDLYIQEQLENLMEKYNCVDLRALFGSKDSQALKDLARLGIRADAVGDDKAWQNRTYSFSLVELPENTDELSDEELLELVYSDDAKIIEDKNGKKGSIIFSDCLIPDGQANGAEINLASILDTMGYDCISKADFIDNPNEYYELMDSIGEKLNDGYYTSSSITIKDMYNKTLDIATATRAVYTANGYALGHSGWVNKTISFEENLELIEKFGLGSAGGNISSGGSGNNSDGVSLFEGNQEYEAEKDKKIKETANKILEEKIGLYKQENGEAPAGIELSKLQNEALQEAKLKA